MTTAYYTRRNTNHGAQASAWGIITDPDGKVRERSKEREQYLDDFKTHLAFLAGLRPGRVLDIGCGRGWMLSAMSGAWEKYGVEPSEEAVQEARRYGQIHHGTFDTVDYPDAYFKLILVINVLEHVEKPEETIARAFKMLMPGGNLVLETPDFDSPCARRFGPNFRLLHDPTHITLMTRDGMRKMLEDAGLLIDRVETPFFEQRHFTKENLLRLFDTTKVSPPFVGNVITFYCRKPDSQNLVFSYMTGLNRLIAKLASDDWQAKIEGAADMMVDQLRKGKKIIVCGNGGSAAQAEHFVAELISAMKRKDKQLPAVALTADSSVVTAIANDFGYENVFAHQLDVWGRPDDVLVAISTSGNSTNVLKACKVAEKRRLHLVSLSGEHGFGETGYRLAVPSTSTQHIQEAHSAILHIMAQIIEERVTA